MKWILLFLVLTCSVGVQCSFGLDVPVPVLTNSITQAIGTGVTALVRTNGTFKGSVEVDSSGTIQALITIANNVSKPMDQLLSGIMSVASARKGNISELFGNINKLIPDTSSAVRNASVIVGNLEGLTKTYLLAGLSTSLDSLLGGLSDLASGWQNLTSAANDAVNSPSPVTLQNITNFINASLVSNVTAPLKAVQINIMGVTAFVSTIGSERTQAIKQQAQINTTINNAVRNVVTAEVNFNRTVKELFQRISQQQINTFKMINQTFAPVYARVDSFNGGNVTNMTTFLSDLAALNAYKLQHIEDSTNYTMEEMYSLLNDQTSLLSNTLLNISSYITNQGVTSNTQFSTQCAQKHIPELQNLPYVKLPTCLTSELTSFRSTAQFAQLQLDQIRDATNALYAQISKLCQRTTGSCAAQLFATFPDQLQWVQVKMFVLWSGIVNDQHIVTGRIRNCVRAATTDLIEAAQAVAERFDSCTGKDVPIPVVQVVFVEQLAAPGRV